MLTGAISWITQNYTLQQNGCKSIIWIPTYYIISNLTAICGVMSCTSLCNVLQCFGEKTPFCDFAVQLCALTIDWTVQINKEINTDRTKCYSK